MAAAEVLAAVFAGVTAAKDIIDFVSEGGDPKSRQFEYSRDRIEPRLYAVSIEAAKDLESILPDRILDLFVQRVDRCLNLFVEVMKGDYLPGEQQSAGINVGACICRELGILKDANGNVLPREWQRQWDRYDCDSRRRSSSSGMNAGH